MADDTVINWDHIPELRPIPITDHCDHGSEARKARQLLDKRDHEIAELRADRMRLRSILAAVVQHAGGMVPLTYTELDETFDLPLDVFGWRGELVVIRVGQSSDDVDGDALDAALAGEQHGE